MKKYEVLILVQFIFISSFSSRYYAESTDCIQTVGDAPICEIVDISRVMDPDSPPGFDCVTEYSNSIHLKFDGQAAIECYASYPIDLDYRSVLIHFQVIQHNTQSIYALYNLKADLQKIVDRHKVGNDVAPADNFQLSFYKKVNTGGKVGPYNLKELDVRYYASIFLVGSQLPWAGNYIFRSVADSKKQTMLTVFIDKDFPLFLSEKGDGAVKPTARFDETKEHVTLPCRVQNWNGIAQLFSPDFEELTDGSFGDDVKFDPRVGFIVKWDPDRIVTGEYRCMTKLGDQNDEMKVDVVAPEDYKEPEEVHETNIAGTIELSKDAQDNYIAQCRSLRKLSSELFGLVNVRSNNPTTTIQIYGCTNPEIVCENRRTGSTTVTHYELQRIFPSGILKCADKETLEYFLGADKNIYYTEADAKINNALVLAKTKEKKRHFLPAETVEIVCEMAEYVTVKPIWWSIHYANNTEVQTFESVKNTWTLLISNDVIGMSCGISLWNSSEWHTSHMPIRVAETLPPMIQSTVTNITFNLGSSNHVVQCKADGIPKPELKWIKNGQEIGGSKTIQSESDEFAELALLFPLVTQEDEGKYTCKASSMLGEAETTFTINVVEYVEPAPPAPPIEVKVTMPGTNTTTIISTTRIITFFQFRPGSSDGQIIIPSKDNVKSGDILYLSVPNINSNPLQSIHDELNLTVKVVEVQEPGSDNVFQRRRLPEEEFTSLNAFGRLVILFAISVTFVALLLIILCGCLYCYARR